MSLNHIQTSFIGAQMS